MEQIKIVVTGSGSGIGKALCKILEEENYKVVGLDLQEDEFCKTPCDVTNIDAVAEILSYHKEARGLVCCAGIGPSVPFHKMTPKDLDKVMDVNFKGTFNPANYLFKYMRNNSLQCSVVCVSSIWGLKNSFGLAGYSASKYAVRSLSHSMNLEGKSKGILSSAACFTYVSSPLVENLPEDIKQKMIRDECPTGKMLTPEEAAENLFYMTVSQLNGVDISKLTDSRIERPVSSN